jgi:predicted nucleotidyltransferase
VGTIEDMAAELAIEARALRRAASHGTLRVSRNGLHDVRLAPGEREYLRAHWPLLSGLRGVLLPEHGVRLAVLYGSLARGDGDAGSDLDLLVSLADDRLSAGFELAGRLKCVSGRRVDIAHLAHVEAQAPLLLDRVLDEGRVLIDRDGQWGQLCERRSTIRVRALRDHRRQMASAALAIKELTGVSREIVWAAVPLRCPNPPDRTESGRIHGAVRAPKTRINKGKSAPATHQPQRLQSRRSPS